MVTCYNCGKQVSDETLICPECGALVRRYEAPPRREPEQNQNPWQRWQASAQNQQQTNWQDRGNQPQGAQQNVPPYHAGYANQQQTGKFRYSTGFTVWLWLCVAAFVFFTYSFVIVAVTITSGTEQGQAIVEMFQQMGLDLATMEGGVEWVATFLYLNAGVLVVEIILELVLFFVRCRRAVLVNLIGGMVLTAVVAVLLGVNVVCLMILLAAVINHLLLKKQLPYMRR